MFVAGKLRSSSASSDVGVSRYTIWLLGEINRREVVWGDADKGESRARRHFLSRNPLADTGVKIVEQLCRW